MLEIEPNLEGNNKKRDDFEMAQICLNCQLPDCNENSEQCLLYHPERRIMDVSTMTLEEKKQVAFEAKERGVKLVAEEKGLPWITVRAWVGAWCRKPKEKKIKELKAPDSHNSSEFAPGAAKAMEMYDKHMGLGLLIDPTPRIEVSIVEKMLEQESISDARIFWAGVKEARGII